jgi:hypothetical protein
MSAIIRLLSGVKVCVCVRFLNLGMQMYFFVT